MPSVERVAALGLALVLAVVVAAAGIRLGVDASWLRPVHRAAASLEVLVGLWLLWRAWRLRAVQLAAALTAALSVLGILGGQNPPAAAAAANLFGGLALAAAFAWLAAGRRARESGPGLELASGIGLLLALQIGLGAWLAIVERFGHALPLHGMLALVLATWLGWVGRARVRGAAGKWLLAAACAAPLAGFTSLQYDYSALVAWIHAAAVAALVAAAAYALGRGA